MFAENPSRGVTARATLDRFTGKKKRKKEPKRGRAATMAAVKRGLRPSNAA